MTSTLADLAVFVTGAAGWSILVKATVLLSLGLAAAWIARRQRASIRHVLLAATFATLLALPLLALLVPAVSIELPLEVRPATAVSTATAGRRAGGAARDRRVACIGPLHLDRSILDDARARCVAGRRGAC